MKTALFAVAFAALLGSGPAQASWAENANKAYPVYTGTNASLARAQASTGYGHRHHRRMLRSIHRESSGRTYR
jgi:hypothetical protein